MVSLRVQPSLATAFGRDWACRWAVQRVEAPGLRGQGQEDPGSLTLVGLARADGQPQGPHGDREAVGPWLRPVGASSRAPEAVAGAGLDPSSGAQQQEGRARSG